MATENYKQLALPTDVIAKTTSFKIPESELYKFAYTKQIIPLSKNVYDGYTTEFIEKKAGKSYPERLFEKYCENSNDVEWIYKNGDVGQQYFSIMYQDGLSRKQWLFYPDYIVKLTNGDVWIIETKGGEKNGHTSNIDIRAGIKFKELKRYSAQYGVKCGFVRNIEDTLYLCQDEYTEEMIGDNWTLLESVIK